ncbi:MAG: MBL fold metallo-hydrolase, partial [Gammaproteobacteria bacterium]|nr:MBL fold metallo-hydrolase [Gammaproteobacteria bacterium]
LVKQGFKGKIICTRATWELCRVLLPDAGFLQEEDAKYANRKKFSKHSPAQPLFTEEDAWTALKQFEPVHFHEDVQVCAELSARFIPAGHILGSSSILCTLQNGPRIAFSGDVGRQNDLVMRAPEPLPDADYLVVESTYGNRRHEDVDPFAFLENIINTTIGRGGIVLMPAFAVGRAQTLLHIIQALKVADRIPNVPVFLNSPMAITATEIFCKHHKEHKLSQQECYRIDEGTTYVRTVEESIALNGKKFPCIIISASGMASGGRVLHHLKSLAPHHKNSIVFAGFQAPGTRGDAIVNGAEHIKIHGEFIPVKAQIHYLDSLSAHGDYTEILDWLGQSTIQPKRVFVTHGEAVPADEMRKHIRDRFGWRTQVASEGEEVHLDGHA